MTGLDAERLGRAGRGALGALLTAASLVGVLTAAAGPAQAHAALLDTVPAQDAALPAAPEQVQLVFNQPVGQQYSAVVVTGPDGTQWSDGPLQVLDTTATQPLRPLGPAGRYEVAYRVVSADGHPISGSYSFTLTTAGTLAGPGTVTPSPSPSPAPLLEQKPKAASPVAEDESDPTAWLTLTAAAVALAALVASAFLYRRRATADKAGPSRRGRP